MLSSPPRSWPLSRWRPRPRTRYSWRDRGGFFGILRIQDGLGEFFEFDNPSGFALPFTPPRTETSFAVGRAFSVAGTGRITLTVGTSTDRYDEVVDCAVTDGVVPFQMEVV